MRQDMANLVDYIRDMGSIQDQMQAARGVASGIYRHNPLSRKVPDLDDLGIRLRAIERECNQAQKTAERLLDELIESKEGQADG